MEVYIRVRFRAPQAAPGQRRDQAPTGGGGRTALRLALVTLMFLGTTIGGLEIGYGLWAYSTINRAAKLGAQYAEAHSSDSAESTGRALVAQEVEHIVRYNASDLHAEALDVATTWSTESASDPRVRVRVSYPLRFFTGSLVFASEHVAAAVPQYKMVATN